MGTAFPLSPGKKVGIVKCGFFVPKTVSYYGAFRRIFAFHNACNGRVTWCD